MDHTIIIDKSNPNFKNDSKVDSLFLRTAFQYFSDVVQCRGYIFLNEMLDLLGCKPIVMGQFYGYKDKEIFIDYHFNSDGTITVNVRNLKMILDSLEW